MPFEVKKKALEKEINNCIKEIRFGPACETEFAIHNENGTQVKIVVTRDDWNMLDDLDSNYINAVE